MVTTATTVTGRPVMVSVATRLDVDAYQVLKDRAERDKVTASRLVRRFTMAGLGMELAERDREPSDER